MGICWQDANFTLREENVSLLYCSPAVRRCKRNSFKVSPQISLLVTCLLPFFICLNSATGETPPFEGSYGIHASEPYHWNTWLTSDIGCKYDPNGSVDAVNGIIKHDAQAYASLIGFAGIEVKDEIRRPFPVETSGHYRITITGHLSGNVWSLGGTFILPGKNKGVFQVWLEADVLQQGSVVENSIGSYESVYKTDLSAETFLGETAVSAVATAFGVSDYLTVANIVSGMVPLETWPSENYDGRFSLNAEAYLSAGTDYEWQFVVNSLCGASTLGLGGQVSEITLTCILDDVTIEGPREFLAKGVPVYGLSGPEGSQTHFRISVPEGAYKLDFLTVGGTGDVDLYVKYGSRSTLDQYDYRPYLAGNFETFWVIYPAPGTWYVMLYGYNDYSDVILQVDYESGALLPQLGIGQEHTVELTAEQTSQTYYLSVTQPGDYTIHTIPDSLKQAQISLVGSNTSFPDNSNRGRDYTMVTDLHTVGSDWCVLTCQLTPGVYEVRLASVNPGETGTFLIRADRASHAVPASTRPGGPTELRQGEEGTFVDADLMNFGKCSLWHDTERRLNWGDWSYSGWQTPWEGLIVDKHWDEPGVYEVTVESRCTENHAITVRSLPLTVAVTPVPSLIYVDDDFNPMTPGWGYDHFAKIQDALDVAYNGVTEKVIANPGVYYENIDFKGKQVTLCSTDPNDLNIVGETIIDGNSVGTVVAFTSGEDELSVLSGFTVQNGSAELGGGIYCEGASPQIENNIIIENAATGDSEWGDPAGGGGIYLYTSPATISGNLICDNSADGIAGTGGGILCVSTSPTITDNIIRGNQAIYGAGISCEFVSSPTIVGNLIANNSAYSRGGGLELFFHSSPAIINTAIVGNYSGWIGGGLYCFQQCAPTIINSTISQNFADEGGGLKTGDCSPTVTNCIIWGNIGGEIRVEASSVLYINHSNVRRSGVSIWSGSVVDWGDGNIDADPRFVDTNNDDYHLLPDSPCIDAADNNSVPADAADLDGDGNTAEPIPWDLDDQPRFADGDCNDTEVVDMGAYEFNYAYMGDLDYNCDVDFDDFAILALAWLTEPPDAGWNRFCDISSPVDNYIDWRDVAILCANWLAEIP